MPALPVDREKLREQVRHLPPENLLMLLDRAIDLLPAAKLAAFMAGHVLPEDVIADSAPKPELLDAVRAFDAASRRGEYYQDFNVNGHNDTMKSPGTLRWLAEWQRLAERAVKVSAKTPGPDAQTAFELLFGLLARIDECTDDIVFFADEAGVWQVGVDWFEVLPAYARCVAVTASPADFARMILGLMEDYAAFDAVRLLPAVRKVVTVAHGDELAQAVGASTRLR